MINQKIINIEQYISSFPIHTQQSLQAIRIAIKEAAPLATETINYGIPTFKLNGNLVHFGAFKNHIGFYPGADAIAYFKDEITGYKSSKGAIQFPLNKALPLPLIQEITLYRVKINMDKA